MTWRESYTPIIAAILHEYPEDTKERRRALRDAYPADERAHWPYKVWLDTIQRMTGKNAVRKPKNTPSDAQLKLCEVAQ